MLAARAAHQKRRWKPDKYMVLTRTGMPIEAEMKYTVGGWASINPDTEGPAIYDILELHHRQGNCDAVCRPVSCH